LLQRCKRRAFAVGTRLIQQGEPARSFFVVSTGILSVLQAPASDPTAEQELARLGPGDFFGELALVSDSPRIASVVATTEGEALEFPGEVLRQLVAAHPAAEAALAKFTRARLLQNAMATSSLFRPFDRDQRKHLIARFVIREVAANAAVLVEGQPSDGLYVVMQGRFAVEHAGQRLATLGVGEVFGEISLLTRAAAGASVTAETGGRVLRLPRKSFDELILTHPQVLEMVSNLADERRQLNEGVASGRVSCDVQGLILM
jgi:CRP-like cAMP-binding protein